MLKNKRQHKDFCCIFCIRLHTCGRLKLSSRRVLNAFCCTTNSSAMVARRTITWLVMAAWWYALLTHMWDVNTCRECIRAAFFDLLWTNGVLSFGAPQCSPTTIGPTRAVSLSSMIRPPGGLMNHYWSIPPHWSHDGKHFIWSPW